MSVPGSPAPPSPRPSNSNAPKSARAFRPRSRQRRKIQNLPHLRLGEPQRIRISKNASHTARTRTSPLRPSARQPPSFLHLRSRKSDDSVRPTPNTHRAKSSQRLERPRSAPEGAQRKRSSFPSSARLERLDARDPFQSIRPVRRPTTPSIPDLEPLGAHRPSTARARSFLPF